MVTVRVKKLPHFTGELPCYVTSGAAGADICACLGPGESLVLKPGQRSLVPTGLSFEIPPGYEVQVRPRSGLAYKNGLMVLNTPGTIDSDYRGEVKIILGNLSEQEQMIKNGDRIAQLVVAPVIQAEFLEVSELNQTERGKGGFGSTGVA